MRSRRSSRDTQAVIANISLITRFLEKRPKVSTLITIGALTSHDVINIIIVTIFVGLSRTPRILTR